MNCKKIHIRAFEILTKKNFFNKTLRASLWISKKNSTFDRTYGKEKI